MKREKTVKAVETALLAALIFVMSYTPIGYLRVGALSITFLAIPVAIGAISIGRISGTILGFTFGLTSFLQCFGGDAFGVIIFSINPFYTAICCFGPRIIMGFLVAVIYEALAKTNMKKPLAASISAFCASLINTVLFLLALYIFFMNETFGEGATIKTVILTVLAINPLIEAVVCTVVSDSVSTALLSARKRHW